MLIGQVSIVKQWSNFWGRLKTMKGSGALYVGIKTSNERKKKKVKPSGNSHGNLKEKEECQLHLSPFYKEKYIFGLKHFTLNEFVSH